MAYSIVSVYGMNDKIGNVSFYDSKQSDYNFTKPYSDTTAETIDNEVRNLIEMAYNRTKDLLIKRKEELTTVAEELLEKEIIFQSDLERLIGKRPFEHQTTYEAFTQSSNGAENKADEDKPVSNKDDKNSSAEPKSSPDETSDEPMEERTDLKS
jgi:cell division protease FtsH